MQSVTQLPAATPSGATELDEETLPRHIANPSIKRDERGHITGLFDVETYFEDSQLCKIKQDVVKLSEVTKKGTVVTVLFFELPSTARFDLRLDEKLREMFRTEKDEFERFFTRGKKFRVTVYECFAPCQNSRDVINIEPL